jgi:hypothetical protein
MVIFGDVGQHGGEAGTRFDGKRQLPHGELVASNFF